jgi:hypothetical protein
MVELVLGSTMVDYHLQLSNGIPEEDLQNKI